MATKKTYIKTKQEVILSDSKDPKKLNKNFSVTFNKMIEHIEELNKLNSDSFKGTVDSKYNNYKDRGYEYIYLTYNENNGRYIIKMSEENANINPLSEQIYSFENAKKDKSNTNKIVDLLEDDTENKKLTNIKKEDIPKLVNLIKKFNKNGKNSFFFQSKEICIREIAFEIRNEFDNKKSEFSAKKIYTMLLNHLNYDGYSSLNEKKEYKDDSKIIHEKYKKFIPIINQFNELTTQLLDSYDYILFDNHKNVFNLYEALSNQGFNKYKKSNIFYYLKVKEDRNYNKERREGNLHNYISYTEDLFSIIDYSENMDGYEEMYNQQNKMLEEIGLSQSDLYEHQLEMNEMGIDPNQSDYSENHYKLFDQFNIIKSSSDYINPLIKLKHLINKKNMQNHYYSEVEIKFMKNYMNDIVNNINECYQLHYAYLKVNESSTIILMLVDYLFEYFEMRAFNKSYGYKKTSAMIKNFYSYKIANKNKYNSDYDLYLDNTYERAQKVIEIEFLDKFIMDNKEVFENIFNLGKNVKSSNDIHILMDALEDKLFDTYDDNLVILERRLKKLDKIEYLYYLMNEINVDVNEPRRIIRKSKEGIELFCKYRYKNKIYPKYIYPKEVVKLTFDDFANGFEENKPSKEYFIKRLLYKKNV